MQATLNKPCHSTCHLHNAEAYLWSKWKILAPAAAQQQTTPESHTLKYLLWDRGQSVSLFESETTQKDVQLRECHVSRPPPTAPCQAWQSL